VRDTGRKGCKIESTEIWWKTVESGRDKQILILDTETVSLQVRSHICGACAGVIVNDGQRQLVETGVEIFQVLGTPP
jgi:hypothetical protein